MNSLFCLCVWLLLYLVSCLISTYKFFHFYLPSSLPHPTWGEQKSSCMVLICLPALNHNTLAWMTQNTSIRPVWANGIGLSKKLVKFCTWEKDLPKGWSSNSKIRLRLRLRHCITIPPPYTLEKSLTAILKFAFLPKIFPMFPPALFLLPLHQAHTTLFLQDVRDRQSWASQCFQVRPSRLSTALTFQYSVSKMGRWSSPQIRLRRVCFYFPLQPDESFHVI